jgi:hypothetical protein
MPPNQEATVGFASSSLGCRLGALRGPERSEGNPQMRPRASEEATVGFVPPLPLRFAPGRFAALRSAARPALDPGEVPPLVLMDLGA